MATGSIAYAGGVEARGGVAEDGVSGRRRPGTPVACVVAEGLRGGGTELLVRGGGLVAEAATLSGGVAPAGQRASVPAASCSADHDGNARR